MGQEFTSMIRSNPSNLVTRIYLSDAVFSGKFRVKKWEEGKQEPLVLANLDVNWEREK